MNLTTVTTNLHLDWLATERSEQGRALLEHLRATRPTLTCATLPEALAEHGPLTSTERHELLAELLRRGAAEPIALRALIQGLLPGLIGLVRQLGWTNDTVWASPGDLVIDAVATAFEVATSWAGQHRAYAGPDLLSAVRLRLRRQAIAERAAQGASLEAIPELIDLRGRLTVEELLCQKVITLDHQTAKVLVGRLVDGYTWQELQQAMGLPLRQIHAIAENGALQLLERCDVAFAGTAQFGAHE
jgi:DNA-directed RNA polymerase specialized sigma24 family protein